ncbi:conjugal transfer ATPase TrbE [Yersinia enterocolitica]|nr:conjugal transfer ATPase TrbE [Yersinia enterocolitica]
MLNLAEYRQRPELLADWLPWAGLIAPGVVLNKDGSFQRTARFRGPDLDSATQGELIATSARLTGAVSGLRSIQHHICQRRDQFYPLHPLNMQRGING